MDFSGYIKFENDVDARIAVVWVGRVDKRFFRLDYGYVG